MEIYCKRIGEWNENSYLIVEDENALLIDPGDYFNELDDFFNTYNVSYLAILNTHGHFDHIGAVEEFRVKYKIPFYLHSKDKRIVHQANLFRKLAGLSTVRLTPKIDFFLDSIQEIDLLPSKLKIHYTPGHSEGSVCFEIGNNLLSGDLIFNDSIGRNDLPGGDLKKLKESIKYLVKNFEGFNIYPGHGIPFVLDKEKISTLNSICNEH